MKYFKLGRIVIVEYFRIMDTIIFSMSVVIDMKLYIRFFQTIANTKLKFIELS